MKCLVALCFVFALPVFSQKNYDQEISLQKSELESLKEQLERERKELNFLQEKKTDVLGKLDLLSRNISLTEEYLHKLRITESTLDKSLRETQKNLTDLEERIRRRNEIMAGRVRTLFMSGPVDKRLLAHWQPGEGDLFKKTFFMKRLLGYDQSLVAAGRADAELKKSTLLKMSGKRAELARFKAHKSDEIALYTKSRSQQEDEVTRIQASVASKKQALKELAENAQLLTEIIKSLEKKRRDDLARNKKSRQLEKSGKYCFPVDGEIVSGYGLQYHATLKTTTKNLGIEIQGLPGTPIRAAVTGEVALITTIPGYGMGVILDNGSGYFTIYANLSAIRLKQGERVKTCQEIASVPAGANHGRVYFEVREGTKTLDPAKWLKQK